jgi:hypothetical protein
VGVRAAVGVASALSVGDGVDDGVSVGVDDGVDDAVGVNEGRGVGVGVDVGVEVGAIVGDGLSVAAIGSTRGVIGARTFRGAGVGGPRKTGWR